MQNEEKYHKTLDGKISGAIPTLIDIDAIKKSNHQLKNSEEFTRSIIETLPEPILVLTGGLRVKASNRSFYDLFQVSLETTLNEFLYRLGNGQWYIAELQVLLIIN